MPSSTRPTGAGVLQLTAMHRLVVQSHLFLHTYLLLDVQMPSLRPSTAVWPGERLSLILRVTIHLQDGSGIQRPCLLRTMC